MLPKVIKIGSKFVGDGHPVYIMADLGLTNGGDIQRTFDLIDIAHEAGVDAVKFQMIGPEYLLGDKEIEYTYPTLKDGPKTENMFSMFSGLSYSEEEWGRIAEYARNKGLEFICTAHFMGAVDILERLEVNIHKICTWSITHKRLVQALGRTGKPFMLDTGMFTAASLQETLGWHSDAGGRGAVILHDFHTTNYDYMNFRSIPYMKEITGFPVGYTPQGRDYDMDFMAIGLGANVLEKRLTVDRAIPQNGHIKALEPQEFMDWMSRVRNLESALGFPAVMPNVDDIATSKWAFKSIYVNRDIPKGTLIRDEMLEGRRPGDGICVSRVDLVCGRRAAIDISAETKLSWEYLQ
jgi:sialic acid synthase SpsE